MDDRRFDNVAKALARGTSRRSLLKGLAGAVLGGGAMVAGTHSGAAFICRQPGVLCAKDAQCCSGSCVNYHCDCPAGTTSCGSQCCTSGQMCQAGQCVAPCSPTTCAAQNVACGSIPDGCGGMLQCGECPSATCSTGSCVQGQCTLTPIAGCCTSASQCDDNDACTVDTCDGGTCQHTPLSCQPQDACHLASCDPTQGCVQTPVADGSGCGSGGQVCQQGTCACPAGTNDCGGSCQQCCSPTDCPGTTCSPATCDTGTCGRSPIAGCCSQDADCGDSSACTTDTCVDNTCQHTPVSCQPSDACHTASCDPAQGCVQSPATDGTACGTGQSCCHGTCCAAGQTCAANGCAAACTPDCAGKECGPDGCGGVCGTNCGGLRCSSTGQCVGCYNDSDCTHPGPCERGVCEGAGVTPGGGLRQGTCHYTTTCTAAQCESASCVNGTCVTTSNCPACQFCNILTGQCQNNVCPECQYLGPDCQCLPDPNQNLQACDAGFKTCYNGQCLTCLADNSTCNNNDECCSGECNPNADLGGGYHCQCRAAVIETCTANIQCCSRCCAIVSGLQGFCVDTTQDPYNCGTCGRQCQSGDICMNGQCCDFSGNNCY